MTDKPTDAELVEKLRGDHCRLNAAYAECRPNICMCDLANEAADRIEQLSEEVRTLRNYGVTAQEKIEQLSALATQTPTLTLYEQYALEAVEDHAVEGSPSQIVASAIRRLVAALQTKEGGDPHRTDNQSGPRFPADDIATPTRPDAGPGGVPDGWKLVPRNPDNAMQRAAFGPVMHGGRDGPVTADYLQQEAAIMVYQKMWDAAPTPSESEAKA